MADNENGVEAESNAEASSMIDGKITRQAKSAPNFTIIGNSTNH